MIFGQTLDLWWGERVMSWCNHLAGLSHLRQQAGCSLWPHLWTLGGRSSHQWYGHRCSDPGSYLEAGRMCHKYLVGSSLVGMCHTPVGQSYQCTPSLQQTAEWLCTCMYRHRKQALSHICPPPKQGRHSSINTSTHNTGTGILACINAHSFIEISNPYRTIHIRESVDFDWSVYVNPLKSWMTWFQGSTGTKSARVSNPQSGNYLSTVSCQIGEPWEADPLTSGTVTGVVTQGVISRLAECVTSIWWIVVWQASPTLWWGKVTSALHLSNLQSRHIHSHRKQALPHICSCTFALSPEQEHYSSTNTQCGNQECMSACVCEFTCKIRNPHCATHIRESIDFDLPV